MKSYLFILASCLTVIFSALAPRPTEAATKALQITPLTANELKALYADKTWLWKTGGGRFVANGQRFESYVREKGKTSIGTGRWSVDDNGKLCILARWTSRADSGRAATCFGHMKAGTMIFQRRHPSGKWYVFRHTRIRSGDEINKLVTADKISAKVKAFQKSLNSRDARR